MVINRVRVPHAHGSASRTFQHRRATIDRKLPFSIEDDEHFFTLIVEMRADSALRLQNAAMQKKQVRIERMSIKERCVIKLSGTAVDGF